MLLELLRIELKPHRKVFNHTKKFCPQQHGKIAIHEHWTSDYVLHISIEHQLTKLPQTASRFHLHVFRF